VKPGWRHARVGEIADHSLGKMLDKAKNRGELRPYLRNLNVRWFGFDLSDLLEMRFLPEEAAKYSVMKGDLVICEGGYPGRAAIWDEEYPAYFQKALHRVRFNEPERNKWFLYYLHFLDLNGKMGQHCRGAGIQHFTGEALDQFVLPIAPLPEQQRILRILDEAFTTIATAKANTEKNSKTPAPCSTPACKALS
jgi:type I restriction enzyme, S subunit